MTVELIPLNPDQHAITYVPKHSAELPFFNLTNYKRNLTSPIKFNGLDEVGHPIHWEVFPNASKEIGAPGVEAHRVWYLLIKPAIDSVRQSDGRIPQIIPLGKVRECLRKVGWTAGGHQEKELIKTLRQIGFAGCVADLWIPTKEQDENGHPKYVQVKGSFSRMSIYAIGEHHLTEEEIRTAKFEYDLEDILYIKLDPLEARIQGALDQRIYDNEYLFSVSPAARRWYELLAPKIFGTVKNKAQFCEVRYSWYVNHHHTLKRYYERRRVVEQMNIILKDHLASGYVSKVEYRAIKEPDQEIDYIIRYYPGEGSKESIARIQGHIYRKRNQKKLAPKEPEKQVTEQGSEAPAEPIALLALSVSTADDEQAIAQLMSFGVVYEKAYELATQQREATRLQLAYWPYREGKPKNLAGWMIRAIQGNYSAPERYKQAQEQKVAKEAAKQRTDAIAACPYCRDMNGFVYVEKDGHKAVRRCTHNPAIEAPNTIQN
jgi:hypothetical protein